MAAINRLIIVFPALVIALAQNPPQQPSPTPTAIRIDVNLVQVDAVVTDFRNRRVTDLQATDFQLFQDGKPQAITNFSYVTAKPETAARKPAAAVKVLKGEVPPPPPVLEPTEVRRTLALIVDDLGLAGENIPRVRSAIRNFLDDQMRPDDLVAIIRTSAGMGALQQFTTDKHLLYAALDRVKYGESRVGLSSFAPLGSAMRGSANLDHFREESLAVGSLGAIRFVVNAMAGFPGRKSAVLFTENIRLIYRGTTDAMVAPAVQQLSAAASRAAVVIHAIDPRGMLDYGVNAADDTTRMSSRRVSRVPAQRQQEVIRTEEGSFVLAQQTGGLFLHDSNDLAGALRKAAEDSDGYYLLGYHPDAGTFESDHGQPRFHRIEVKVRKAGLHVRSREGFFGEPGTGNQSPEHTREAELNRALQSPYSGAIHPRLTAVFSNLRQTGSFLSAFIYFDPRELQWSSDPDGNHRAQVDVAALTLDENGKALATVDTTFPLLLNPQQYTDASRQGMVYGLYVPVTKPGPYLMRAAVRDPATDHFGSAEQFVEVPDFDSGHLMLSGIVLQDASVKPNAEPAQGRGPSVDFTAGGARRAFQRGTAVIYYYDILNAGTDAGQHRELDLQTRLFRDGEQVLAYKTPANTAGAADPQRLRASGRLALGRDITPGEYVLQVVVTDKLAKSKFGTVTESVDFEVKQ